MKNRLLEKTFRVLELAAAAEEPVSLKQLGEMSGIPPSTLSRIAADLVEAGYLVRSGPRRFGRPSASFCSGRMRSSTRRSPGWPIR